MSEYEAKLAEWKAKHGFSEARPDICASEMKMLHEEQNSNATSWCVGCDIQMLVREMKLITRYIDAYIQIDEGPTDYIAKSNRVRMCPACFEEKYGQNDQAHARPA